MDKKTTLIVVMIVAICLIGFIYVAYLIDTNKIATQADVQSTESAEDLTSLPSPDKSIISTIYSAIISPFVGNK
mgnify:CR=1 FL=1